MRFAATTAALEVSGNCLVELPASCDARRVLAGLAGRAVEQSLAQLQLPLGAPIASQGDFGRLLFATLGAIKPEAGARATKSSRGAATATAAGPDDDGMATLGMGRAKGHRRRGLGGMCGACACGQRRRRAYDA